MRRLLKTKGHLQLSMSDIQLEFDKLLPSAFSEKELRNLSNQLQEKYTFSDSSKSKLTKDKEKLNLVWNSRNSLSLFTKKNTSPNELEILSALIRAKKNSYASHISALYLNELLEQKPKDHILSMPIKPKDKQESQINEFLIQQSFMKEPRSTSNYFTYKSNKYYFLEKGIQTNIGLIEKTIHINENEIVLKITDIERTLIDCIMAPQYSGGILTVITAFKNAKLDLIKLKSYYDKLNPTYPYWQSIGLILEKSISDQFANTWEDLFKNNEKKTFFLDHKFKTYWKLSQRWNVYYPNGIFLNDNN